MNRKEAKDKYQGLFQQFYQAYPRKVDSTPALGIFIDLMLEGVDPQMLIEKAKAFARNVDPSELRWTPSPKTWLRDRKFEDEDLFTNQRVQERDWLRGCWQRGDSRAVSEKTGFLYTPPAMPETVEDRDAWHFDQRRAWIAAVGNHLLNGGPYPE